MISRCLSIIVRFPDMAMRSLAVFRPHPRIGFLCLLLAGFAACYAAKPALADTAHGPAILQAIVHDGGTSLQLPQGRFYVYGMATGGAFRSTPFASGECAHAEDADGYLSCALAYGTDDQNSYRTSTNYHCIGGVSIAGSWTNFKAFYGSNTRPGAPSASVTFTVTGKALVVVIGVASSQQSTKLLGLPGLKTDASPGPVGTVGMAIGHVYLGPGTYTASEKSSVLAPAQDPRHMTDLIGVFVFASGHPTLQTASPRVTPASFAANSSSPISDVVLGNNQGPPDFRNYSYVEPVGNVSNTNPTKVYPLGTKVKGTAVTGYFDGVDPRYSDIYPDGGIRISTGQNFGRAWYDFGPAKSNGGRFTVRFTWMDNGWWAGTDMKRLEFYDFVHEKWDVVARWRLRDGKEHIYTLSYLATAKNVGPAGNVRVGFSGDPDSIIHLKNVYVAGPVGIEIPPTQQVTKDPWVKPGWILTFHDEFDGISLDTSKWIDSYPSGVRTHGNNEQEYYSTSGYQEYGGQLHLIARNQAEGGKPYSSGMIASYGYFSQQYGWFEIRAKFPSGKGMWPAFWLLPSDGSWPPEIDVLEILGNSPHTVYFTNHWGTSQDHKKNSGLWSGPDFSQAFHTFAIDWEPGSIIWYVDGVERFKSTEGVPSQSMYLIANLAVGGDWPGDPDASTAFPTSMDIDYIRVYKKADSGVSETPSPYTSGTITPGSIPLKP